MGANLPNEIRTLEYFGVLILESSVRRTREPQVRPRCRNENSCERYGGMRPLFVVRRNVSRENFPRHEKVDRLELDQICLARLLSDELGWLE